VIQHIRDESHDHAISGHRKKRAKVKNTSSLETIEGVGPKRRQMLLKYMGGLRAAAGQRRRNCQSTGHLSRSGRKDLLLVETLGLCSNIGLIFTYNR
jgi:hypothetical protein